MKKQTFEILPLQGVYWKDKDLKLTFGMPLNQFDEYFPTVTNLQNGIASKVSSRGSSKVLRIPLPWK